MHWYFGLQATHSSMAVKGGGSTARKWGVTGPQDSHRIAATECRKHRSTCSHFAWLQSLSSPRDSCSLRQGTTTSLRSSSNCTGWEHRRGFSSSLLFLCTSVCTGQHHRISPMSSSTRLISRPLQRCLQSASSLSLNVRHTQLSAVSDRCFPVAAARTWNSLSQHVCHVHSPHPLCLFSEVASRLSFSGVPSHEFYCNFCSACGVTVVTCLINW